MLKRVLSVMAVVMFLQVFFVRSAMADDKDEKKDKVEKKVKDHKWWYFAALPVYYFGVEITLHESSHAVAIGLNPNYEVTKFQPYLHYDAVQGRVVFGSVSMTCKTKKACADKTGLGVIALAPYIMMPTLFTTSDVLLATKLVEPTSVAGRVLYFAGMVAPWWDFTYNTFWAVKGSDLDQIAQNFHMRRSSVMVKGILVSLVGTWRLWAGYKRAFPKQNHNHAKESSLVVTPMGDADTIGVSAHMQF